MIQIKIPEFTDAASSLLVENPNALDIFVTQNEPIGFDRETEFRDGLRSLIDYVVGEVQRSNELKELLRKAWRRNEPTKIIGDKEFEIFYKYHIIQELK